MAAKLEAADGCGARAEAERLQAETIAAVNAGRVPTRYQEELGAAVSSLVASIECTPPVTTTTEEADDSDDESDEARPGKRKGKGEHKGRKK